MLDFVARGSSIQPTHSIVRPGQFPVAAANIPGMLIRRSARRFSVINRLPYHVLACLLLGVLLAGCATPPRTLMPTPLVYQEPDGPALFTRTVAARQRPAVDLLYVTDRAPETDPESDLPYGQERARRIVFGSAEVEMLPSLDWASLEAESRLAERDEEIVLSLGEVTELGAFPQEPFRLRTNPAGEVFRTDAVLAEYEAAKQQFQAEIRRRLENAPTREAILYVHGFNETFASAAYTAADLCHYLGREHLCMFFTWPASSSGNFLISYTSTTESAEFAVDHLKKTIRLVASMPELEGVQLLAHSRGTAVLLSALRELLIETIAAGKEPVEALEIDNVVLFSPDIDLDIAGQQVTAYISDPDLISVWPEQRLPRGIRGRLTVYASPEDRALRVSSLLFRSRSRLGGLAGLPPEAQAYLARIGRLDMVVYEGDRTDAFGHSYFTTNPRVSSDVIQMLRYGKRLGEPGRELVQTGPVVWEFPRPGDGG